MRIHGIVLAGTLTIAVAQTPAAAADEESGGIQEIVVTAQKRAENLQNVPISISAFDSRALSERGIENVSQLAEATPNVTLDSGVSFSSSTAVLAASIRGIGASDFALNIDPAVGVYVDGVYLARSVGANQDLLDVERIEILKGPQGTLFGRNTIGGAISIVTRDPGDGFKVLGDVTTGRFDLLEARFAVDLPIADNLTSSVTAEVKTRNGYGSRIPYPSSLVYDSRPFTAYPAAGFESPSREGDEDNRIVRAKLKYHGGNLNATLSADYQYTSGSSPTSLLLTTENLPGTFANLYNACIGTPVATLQTIGLLNVCSSSGTQYPSVRGGTKLPVNRLYGLAGVNADGNPNNNVLPYGPSFLTGNPDVSYANGNNFSHLDNSGVMLSGTYDLTDALQLKSITAYRNSRWTSGIDGEGSPINMASFSFRQTQNQTSQEFQLTGKALDDRINYVAGAYYFDESGYLDDLVQSGEGLYIIDGPNWLTTKNYAGFGQLDFRMNDLVGVTVGGRYTNESKTFIGGQQELNGLFYKLAGNACSDVEGNIYPSNLLPSGQTCRAGLNYPTAANPLQLYPPGLNRQSSNNFSPKVGIQLHPSREAMLYASWSEGYKSGGWTTRYSTPQTDVSSFKPEKATTYELGAKTTWLDNRLQVNGAIFQTNFNAIQLNYEVGSSPTIANVGDAKIKGVEMEVIAAPTNALTLNLSLGYLDAYYTHLDPAVAATSGPSPLEAGAIVGGPLPKTPKVQVNFNPKYVWPLANGGKITLLADYTYISSMANNVERTYVLIRPDVSMVNADVSYSSASDRYKATIGGTNLTDKRYLVSGSAIPAFGAITGSYNRPVEWYARLGFKF